MEVRILNQHSNWLCIIVTLSYPHAAHEGFRFRIPKFRFSSPSRQMRLWLRATEAYGFRLSVQDLKSWTALHDGSASTRFSLNLWHLKCHLCPSADLLCCPISLVKKKKTCLSNSTIHAYENAYLHMRYGKAIIFLHIWIIIHIRIEVSDRSIFVFEKKI